MSCSLLNHDMHTIGILSSPACACGAQVENAYNYFVECSKYIAERDVLQIQMIRKAPFTLNTQFDGSQNYTKADKRYMFSATKEYILSTSKFN